MGTLWSGMNKISGAARSMGKSHRQGVLDDYMRDSNWKKTVGIGKFLLRWFLIIMLIFSVSTLITKLKQSQISLDSTEPGFEQLTNSCLQRKLPVEAWRSAERLAMEKRGEYLRIFDINHQKVLTLAEITLLETIL